MASPTEIVVERQSANDAEAIVVEIRCASGTAVTRDQPILAIETSKAVEEIHAPIDGILVHQLKTGDAIPFGVAIAEIREAFGATPSPPVAAESAQTSPPLPAASARRAPRLSRAAAALAAQHGIAPDIFTTDFVTAVQVRQHLGLTTSDPGAPVKPEALKPVPSSIEGLGPVDGLESIPARKREEIRVLSRGAAASMLSVVGVEMGAIGLERSDLGPMFERRITDIVIYEAARLMRRFRKLNAAWHEGGIEYHPAVNAGIAYDDGGRLAVYGIAQADELSLDDIQDAILDGFKKYVTHRLSVQELTRATFTVTDLSPTQTDFLLPLLPQGQSAIIGIAGSSARGFRLYIGFDHRVTEGLEASRFLQELAGRVRATVTAQAMIHLRCGVCGEELASEDGAKRHLLRVVDRNGAEMFCCHSCWNGESQAASTPVAGPPTISA